MRLRPFLPLASIALAGIAAYMLYNLRAPQRSYETSTTLSRYTVSGRIVTSNGTPPRDMSVAARFRNGRSTTGTIVPVKEDGTFAVTGLEPARYVLATRRRGDRTGESAPIEGGFTVVDLGDADVSGVTLKTTPGVDVSARIRYEPLTSGSPTPHVIVHARLDAGGMEAADLISAVAQPDGSAVLYDVYGPRVIDFGWGNRDSGGWGPKSVLLNGTDITEKAIDFSTIANRQVEIVFARRRRTPGTPGT